MNEKTPLIGTPVNVTVFAVDYKYMKPARKNKLPKSAKKELDEVVNRVVITSGDASGADVYYIAQRLVLGPTPYEGSDFRVLNFQRVVDAMGLASATTWDKLDGKAPETVNGNDVTEDPEDPSDDGGSIPPGAELN